MKYLLPGLTILVVSILFLGCDSEVKKGNSSFEAQKTSVHNHVPFQDQVIENNSRPQTTKTTKTIPLQKNNPARKEISFEPLMGGIGGHLVKVMTPDTGDLSVYHLPPGLIPQGSPKTIKTNLIRVFQANANEAGKTLPIEFSNLSEFMKPEQTISTSELTLTKQKDAKKLSKRTAVQKQKLVPKVVDVLQTIDIKNGHPIINNDVDINGQWIKDIRLLERDDSSEWKGTIMLNNKTDIDWRPNIQFTIVNKYGIKIGETELKWAFDTIKPGKRKSETLRFKTFRHKDLFKYSRLGPVDDFNKPFGLVIDYLSE